MRRITTITDNLFVGAIFVRQNEWKMKRDFREISLALQIMTQFYLPNVNSRVRFNTTANGRAKLLNVYTLLIFPYGQHVFAVRYKSLLVNNTHKYVTYRAEIVTAGSIFQ